MGLVLWTLRVPKAVLVIIREPLVGQKEYGCYGQKTMVQSPSLPLTSQGKFEEVM